MKTLSEVREKIRLGIFPKGICSTHWTHRAAVDVSVKPPFNLEGTSVLGVE